MATPVQEARSASLTPARALLRRRTHDAHRRLEGTLMLTSPLLTRGLYATVLRRYRAVYGVLEPRLDAHVGALDSLGLQWASRRKLPLLERDVEALGLEGPTPSAPPELLIPCTQTLAQAMGCLYVMEGATLGGKVIARHLGERLHVGPGNGAAFFDSYGADVGPRWLAFCEALERGACNDASRERAAEAALGTFELFIHYLGGPEGHVIGSSQP